MIPGIRGRRRFDELRRHGRRTSAGAVRITFNSDATASPRLAFALNRRIGSAVDRNRARRRLRVIFAELGRDHPDLVGAGDYLIAVYRTEFRTEEARSWLRSALEQLQSAP